MVRPVRELKAFRKITISPGETKEVEFILSTNDFSFYQEDLSFKAESGKFNLFVGGSSAATTKATFFLR
ncbi:MAG: fibronectin type III-like domain-contianing protein [Sediminibacterium sp.]